MANRRNVTYSSHPNHAARSAHSRADKMFRTYDTSAIKPKKSKKPYVFAAILAVVLIGALVFLALNFFKGCSDDANLLPEGETVQVVIEPGSGAQAIGQKLKEAGLISDVSAFTKRVAALGADTQLKPGTYTFAGGTSLDGLIEQLKKGAGPTGTPLSVPEGYTLKSIGAAVEKATNGRITADSFIKAASDASVFAADYPFLKEVGTNSLEGFLFPKTYYLSGTETENDIIRMMLDQFKTETAALKYDYPTAAGLSEYDALKLASIVEKESTPSTREKVASVFYNRLAIDMALQSDATTAYEVGADPTAEQVHADTPYSTYTNKGLPPTPICSPSIESLRAVLEPAETDYLYFYFEEVDGQLQYSFSETYDEHLAAIG